jgi:hypothetical protein
MPLVLNKVQGLGQRWRHRLLKDVCCACCLIKHVIEMKLVMLARLHLFDILLGLVADDSAGADRGQHLIFIHLTVRHQRPLPHGNEDGAVGLRLSLRIDTCAASQLLPESRDHTAGHKVGAVAVLRHLCLPLRFLRLCCCPPLTPLLFNGKGSLGCLAWCSGAGSRPSAGLPVRVTQLRNPPRRIKTRGGRRAASPIHLQPSMRTSHELQVVRRELGIKRSGSAAVELLGVKGSRTKGEQA